MTVPGDANTERWLCRTELGWVHHLTCGPERAPRIVLLHQTPRSIDEFREVIPLLADRLRVLAIDCPGYGASDAVPGQPTVEEYARCVAQVMTARGFESACLLGHHTGALVAVELAARDRDRVEALVLSGPVYTDREARDALAPHFEQWTTMPDGSHLLAKWEKFRRWTSSPDLVQRLIRDLFTAGETSEQGHFAVARYEMERSLPLAAGLPALILLGRSDPFVSPANLAAFHRHLRVEREIVLEGGVFLPNEAPEPFSRAVLDFFPARTETRGDT